MPASYFNPRPPRGGRPETSETSALSLLFQSTPSARRATVYSLARFSELSDFNPRPPRGGRLGCAVVDSIVRIFQSTPSARRATARKTKSINLSQFQSTPSARRATGKPKSLKKPEPISIHALREEGDAFAVACSIAPVYFNPRPPRGGRPAWRATRPDSDVFQSTPSARRATWRWNSV